MEVHNTCVTTILIISVIGVLIQADRSGAISSYQRYRRRHIAKPPCNNGISNNDDSFSDFEAKIRDTEFVFTGKVTAEIPSVGNSGSLRRNGGELTCLEGLKGLYLLIIWYTVAT
jgi:hypothetical protein